MLAHNYSPTLAHTSLHRRQARPGWPANREPRLFCPRGAAIRKMKRNRNKWKWFRRLICDIFARAQPNRTAINLENRRSIFQANENHFFFFQKKHNVNSFSAMISANWPTVVASHQPIGPYFLFHSIRSRNFEFFIHIPVQFPSRNYIYFIIVCVAVRRASLRCF